MSHSIEHIVHHQGKDPKKGGRGHSSLLGAVEAEIRLARPDDDVRVARVAKLRDGAECFEFAFRLDVVDLGQHPDPNAGPNVRLTSCVVVPADAPPGTPTRVSAKSKKVSSNTQVVLDPLRVAIERSGEALPATSELPGGVRAVRIDAWQRAYETMRPLDGALDPAEARKARNSRRMAFNRGVDDLQAQRIAGTGGAEFWWLRS